MHEILSKIYIFEFIFISTNQFYCKITFAMCTFFGKSFSFNIIILNHIVCAQDQYIYNWSTIIVQLLK